MFARKLLRPFGSISTSDIKKEIRTVAKLCRPGLHPNIVPVLSLGKLRDSSCYYIDMELCALNLDAYIQRKWTTRVLEGLPQFVKVDTLPIEHQLEQIRLILSDITNGVAFLHSRKAVHRDLKPANGINPRQSI